MKHFSARSVLYIIVLFISQLVCANTLYFDSTFGSAGFVNQSLNINATGAGIVVGPNPSSPSTTSITVAGTTELSSGGFTIFLTRYTSAGVLDTSFGSSGYATVTGYNAQATSLSLQADGKLVVSGFANIGGTSQIIVARFTSTGVLDGTFGSGGITTTAVPGSAGSASYASLIDQNQQPVIAGSVIINGISTSVVARYNTDGTLDGSFGSGGIFTTTIGAGSAAQGLVLDSSNNIVVGGYALNTSTLRTVFAVFRLTTAGALDGTFGSGGVVTTVVPSSTHDVIVGIGVQSTGAIVVVGNSQLSNNLSQITLARYTNSGVLDTTFGSSGFVAYAPGNSNGATSMLIQASNSPIDSIVIAGTSDNQFLLARFTSTGAVDTTFGVNGTVLSALNSFATNNAVAIQIADGKLVTAGSSIAQDQTNQNYTINRNLANNNDITITNVANAQVGYTATPTLTGNVAPIFFGSGLVQLILDGVTLSSTVPIASDGSWSFVVSTPQTNGPHTLVANLLNPGIIATVTSNFAIVSNNYSLIGNLNLAHTSPPSDLGVITKAGIRFLHDYSATSNLTNVFLGSASGNFTANSSAIQNTAVGAATMQNLVSGADNTAIGYTSLQLNASGNGNVAIGSGALQNYASGANTAIGYLALNAATRGNFNTAVGYQALQSNTTGTNNVAIGDNALASLASSISCTAIGSMALFNNKASLNTAIGYQSMYSNTTGTLNLAIGYQSLFSNTTGNFNLAVGHQALMSNVSGTHNTALGHFALMANTASSNTAAGYLALTANTTGIQNTAFGYQSMLSNTTGINNVAIGDNALQLNVTGIQNVAVGSSALQNNLTSSNTAVGYNAMIATTTGGNNTAVGFNALTLNVSGIQNVAIGSGALQNNASGSNTAVGYNALNANTIGAPNTAVGYLALLSNTTGANNTAVGYQALLSNASGIQNIAIGSGALQNNASGSNTAIGFNALKSNTTGGLNTALGVQALTLNTTGVSNVAIGENALAKNASGSNNTAIGARALNNLIGGTNNFAGGITAGTNYTSGESNNIVIANNGTAGESATIRIGSAQTKAFIAGIRGVTTGNADAINVLIDSAGQLGTVSSSARFKENIRSLDSLITDKLARLNPVSFNYKSDPAHQEEWGLIAEQVKEILPELVVDNGDGIPFTVRYHILPSLLLKAWQEDRRKIQELQTRIDDQNALARQLQTIIAQQKTRIDELHHML